MTEERASRWSPPGHWIRRGGRLRFLAWVLVVASCEAAERGPEADALEHPATVLKGVTLIDGTGRDAQRDQVIVVEGGVIREVGSAEFVAVPAGAKILELDGAVVIPGLIDSHVHLATAPNSWQPTDIVRDHLEIVLRSGVTTVRDMAGDARVLRDLAEASWNGDIASPRIYYAALMAGPEFHGDGRSASASEGIQAGGAPWMRAVDDAADIRLIIQEAVQTGATGIKLYSDLTPRLVQDLTAEAKRQGLLVWTHFGPMPAGPFDVLSAGVHSASHAGDLLMSLARTQGESRVDELDWALGVVRSDGPELDSLLTLMRVNGVVLEPTLWAGSYAVSAPGYRWQERWLLRSEITRAAIAAGVDVSAGTDAMYTPPAVEGYANLHEELVLLHERAGMSVIEAIRAGTLNAAKVIGLADVTGSIEAGKWADLVILCGDPGREIRNTRCIHAVMKGGEWVVPPDRPVEGRR